MTRDEAIKLRKILENLEDTPDNSFGKVKTDNSQGIDDDDEINENTERGEGGFRSTGKS